MSSKSKVKVAVRVRPFNRREISLGTKCCVEMEGNTTYLLPFSGKGSDRKSKKTFNYDHCFCSMEDNSPNFSGQSKVFECLGLDLLDNSFEGYNACIFAYGQTGSGKSFTMMGTEDNKGLTPRLCDTLFERILEEDTNDSLSFKVEVSYIEIYNEKVRDLLDPRGKQGLRVREHKIYGPYVDGLSALAVSSFQDIESLMSEGNKSRTVAATNMNHESSRSHAVFNITLTQTLLDIETNDNGEVVSAVSGEKVSKISLVDLAGSERVSKTGSTGDRLKEGSNINRSLTTLGLVISALAEQAAGKRKSNFVPYRDSVLTWLLKDSLGGNSKTVMIATISPSGDNYEETLSTLRYADRAKRIVNHAVINEDPNAKIIRELREEVDMLKKQLKKAESLKADHLKERLQESEKLMEHMTVTWEEKLTKTERIHKERQHALEQMGISVQASGIKVERNKCFLVNLNADPSLNELLVYYLKEHTLVGRPETRPGQDIQLSGLGISPQHCIIDIHNHTDVSITPLQNARTCVNGVIIKKRTALRHGDRILWGNNHFFRINCPRSPGVGSSGGSTPEPETKNTQYDFNYAQNEVMMQELENDPIQAAMTLLEDQHKKDKDGALEKQRQMYEQQLESLRKQLQPKVHRSEDSSSLERCSSPSSSEGGSEANSSMEDRWADAREDEFKQCLAKLKEDVLKANALAREANFLSEEMTKQTEFHVTLQIPAANLTPNRKRGVLVSEPAIKVKRKGRGTQVWSVEKLENKIVDMRELYGEKKEKYHKEEDGIMHPLRKMSFFESQDDEDKVDPFYEYQENHNLIGVANIFLEVLFHDVKLEYPAPIINQQGEVAGRLHVELQRINPPVYEKPDVEPLGSNESESGFEVVGENEVEGLAVGAPLCCRIKIVNASELPLSLAHFVFCQYTFWGQDGPMVVPPLIGPDTDDFVLPRRRSKDSQRKVKFNHTREFTVNVSEEFVEHALEGSLAVEVWGHRSSGTEVFSGSNAGWQMENIHAKSRSLADRWKELTHKVEMWVEIQELNEQGDYVSVECTQRPDILSGGVFQLRQGQSRRVKVWVQPVQNSGTLPIICEAITAVSIGSITNRSKLQKALDSYQDGDLNKLRDRWSEALMKRREHLDEQIHKIINKKEFIRRLIQEKKRRRRKVAGKTEQDMEREASLINQWVSLTEERNAVLVPAHGSGIPGAVASWHPPAGMETHVPVLFLDLNTDDMGAYDSMETFCAAAFNSILPKEHGAKMISLPIVKYNEKDVCAIASWDSSIHDSAYLNRVTSQDERIYLIIKVIVQLSHPAMMELVLRKRICVNVYKKQSLASTLKRKISKVETHRSSGVTYEIVANIPKALEDPEDRETLAMMAATGAENKEGESYIEKYTKGVSAVESILALDRLRQEVIIKEKLSAQGKLVRKTASVPNIHQAAMSSTYDMSRSESFDNEFRMPIRSESLRNLSFQHLSNQNLFAPHFPRPRSLCLSESSFPTSRPEVFEPYGANPSNLQFGNLSSLSYQHLMMSGSNKGLNGSNRRVGALKPVREELRMNDTYLEPSVLENKTSSYELYIEKIILDKSLNVSPDGTASTSTFLSSLAITKDLGPSTLDTIPIYSVSSAPCTTYSSDKSSDFVSENCTLNNGSSLCKNNIINSTASIFNHPLEQERISQNVLTESLSSPTRKETTVKEVAEVFDNNSQNHKREPFAKEVPGRHSSLQLKKESSELVGGRSSPVSSVSSGYGSRNFSDFLSLTCIGFDDDDTDDNLEDSNIQEISQNRKSWIEDLDKSTNHDFTTVHRKHLQEEPTPLSHQFPQKESKPLLNVTETSPRKKCHETVTSLLPTQDSEKTFQKDGNQYFKFDKLTFDESNNCSSQQECINEHSDVDASTNVLDDFNTIMNIMDETENDANVATNMHIPDILFEHDTDNLLEGVINDSTETTHIDKECISNSNSNNNNNMCKDFQPEFFEGISKPISIVQHNESNESPAAILDVKTLNCYFNKGNSIDKNQQRKASKMNADIETSSVGSFYADSNSSSDTGIVSLGSQLSVYSWNTSSNSVHDTSMEEPSVCIPSWVRLGVRARFGKSRIGEVAFLGKTSFKEGMWAGLRLDKANGKNDGCINGVRYFMCKPEHGVFVRPYRLRRIHRESDNIQSSNDNVTQ
ncbi:kinesin-like protein KIF13A isoform X3 [Antedon mediterranea]|uniref:kinesin-like protein KIF13A isoform X3 n=1 Tax=Antedon mediterranea TaxID=105859 RepID=UPI003AF57A85